MMSTDKEVKSICNINFEGAKYTLQKVINKNNDVMYTIVEANDPNNELYSCYPLDLGNMLQNLINCVEG